MVTNKEKILTPYFQLDIIELRKAIKEYETNTSDEVLQWMKFLDNPESEGVNKIMKENKDIKNAKDELDLISRDDTLRWLALRAEITRMDNEQLLYEAKRDGTRKDIEQGRIEGKKDGEKSKSIEIAKKLLLKGLPSNEISEITGLSKEEIEKL